MSQTTLPANGIATARVHARFLDQNLDQLPGQIRFYIKEGPDCCRIIQPADSRALYVDVQAKLTPGTARIIAICNGKEMGDVTLIVSPDRRDSDNDGFPDVVELTDDRDRKNFLRWFVRIAESQFYRISPEWCPEQRDCSGLVRFAYREALKRHSDHWFSKINITRLRPIPDVEKYHYPNVPLIGENIFRRSNLPLESAGIDSIFTNFVETRFLMHYNCRFLSKDRSNSQSGDMVFFFHFDNPSMPYHSMVFVKDDLDSRKDCFIYHTGPADQGEGEVRKIDRDTLKRHPDKRWRPEKDNPYFLGYFRWKIVD